MQYQNPLPLLAQLLAMIVETNKGLNKDQIKFLFPNIMYTPSTHTQSKKHPLS